jgi:hypothetical protein
MDATATLLLPAEGIEFPSATKALSRLLRLKPTFSTHDVHSPRRPALEAYIGQQFEQAHGATVTEFLPTLISMQCQERISAVSGIRAARDGDLFAERYLDAPIEQMLSWRSNSRVQRPMICEIGNLSATHRGATLLFFALQAAILHEAGFEWAVFTATDQVEKIVTKLDFVTVDLGLADPERLGHEAAQWGQYYDTRPRLLAIHAGPTIARLRRSPLPAAVFALFSDTIAELAHSLKNRAR